MIEKIKIAVKNSLRSVLDERRLYPDYTLDSVVEQVRARQSYQRSKAVGEPLPKWDSTGYSIYSQTDEDGKINYIFSLIGEKTKRCIDIAFANPYGANTTNLMVNFGWHGLLIEGGDTSIGQSFFNMHKGSSVFPPILKEHWVEPDNINQLISQYGYEGEIDLLSLDVDGMDYWMWKALDVVSPRLVIVEYQDICGPDLSVTVPFSSKFVRTDVHPDFFGASLSAYVKLAHEKGYRLIGTNGMQYNAFFLRNDTGTVDFPEIETASCFTHPKVAEGRNRRWPEVKDLDWQEV